MDKASYGSWNLLWAETQYRYMSCVLHFCFMSWFLMFLDGSQFGRAADEPLPILKLKSRSLVLP